MPHDPQAKPQAKPLEDTTPDGGEVSQRPEVKPLVDKAGATKLRETPPGTMVTGADTPGGGAAKPLDLDTPHKPGAGAPAKGGPA
jgi:hypothetical protein